MSAAASEEPPYHDDIHRALLTDSKALLIDVRAPLRSVPSSHFSGRISHIGKSLLNMGWLTLVGSIKLYVSFAEYHLFYRAPLQKKPTI